MSIFVFEDYSGSAERELALLLGKVTHHVHPNIISLIQEENKQFKSVFGKYCSPQLELESFFYDKSDCVFPGFRRPVNFEKQGSWKNKIYNSDGTILNDNTFPRHIWAYLSMGCAYSGGSNGMWEVSGLGKFELAHVFSHKQDERYSEEKIFKNVDRNIKPYGHFTSASNVVLIPKGYAKPTDSMLAIKACFFKRHLELYGNNMCGLQELDSLEVPEWYGDVEWLEPKLPADWEQKISLLLKYRAKYLKQKYASYL